MNIRATFRKLVRSRVVAIAMMIAAGCPLVALSEEGRSIGPAPGEQVLTAQTSSACAAGLRTFVTELDKLLAVHPQAPASLLSLLDRTFPLKSCAIAEVISICKQSRYFVGAGKTGPYHVISFNNGKFFDGKGYHVSFGVHGNTGDTEHPSIRSNTTSS